MNQLTSTQFTDWKVFRTQDESGQWLLVVRGYWVATATVPVELVFDEGGIYTGSNPNVLNLILQIATEGRPSPELEYRTETSATAWDIVSVNFPDGSAEYIPLPGSTPAQQTNAKSFAVRRPSRAANSYATTTNPTE